METLIANVIGRVRRVVENGKSYLVAPLSLIVPGVLPGSQGPLYYPPEETRKNPSQWNYYPLTVYHPMDPVTNQPLSASDSKVYERQGIGHLRNAHATRSGRLRATGWFDEEKTKQVDNRVYQRLIKGDPIELSTGLYTVNDDAAPGSVDSKGRPYSYIARNYRPDHVAVLPDQVGACSLKDGCGVLINMDTATETGNDAQTVSNAVSADLKAKKTVVQKPLPKGPKKKAAAVVAPSDGTPPVTAPSPSPSPALEPVTNRGFWQRIGELFGLAYNARQNLDTGHFLPEGGKPSLKQTHSAAVKGHATQSDDGRQLAELEHEEESKIDGEEDDHQNPHLPVKNGYSYGGSMFNGEPHDASKSATSASVMTEHAPAMKPAMKAMGHSGADEHDDAVAMHTQAAEAHESAATDSRKDKEPGAAEQHDTAAALHRKAASMHSATRNAKGTTDMTPQQREQLVHKLAVNCGCGENAKDKAAFNQLSDEALIRMGGTLTANTSGTMGSGSSTVQVGGEETADDHDIDSDEGKGLKDSTKVGGGKLKGKGKVDNATSITERLTPKELEVWNNAVEINQQTKQAIVNKLTGHLKDETQKQRLVANLMTKSLPDLRERLELIPPQSATPVSNRKPQDPLFLGNGGGPDTLIENDLVANASDKEDILPLPTINWAEEAGVKKAN